jgi:hypothetical protein
LEERALAPHMSLEELPPSALRRTVEVPVNSLTLVCFFTCTDKKF